MNFGREVIYGKGQQTVSGRAGLRLSGWELATAAVRNYEEFAWGVPEDNTLCQPISCRHAWEYARRKQRKCAANEARHSSRETEFGVPVFNHITALKTDNVLYFQ